MLTKLGTWRYFCTNLSEERWIFYYYLLYIYNQNFQIVVIKWKKIVVGYAMKIGYSHHTKEKINNLQNQVGSFKICDYMVSINHKKEY